MRRLLIAFVVLALPLRATAQSGDVAPVHDPSVARVGDGFAIVNTGRGAPMRTSPDLFTWHRADAMLPTPPAWTRQYNGAGDSLWAPDLSLVDGQWRLYYAVSRFGSRHSAIGLATSPTMDPAKPDYHWTDAGPVVATVDADNWNAIDPCATIDADGHGWLVCGSCWSGIKLFPLTPAGLVVAGSRPIAIAAHPPDNIIEEGYVRRHGADYVLWVSVGHCCRGVFSDYRILVGRSARIDGPYRDRDSRPMLDGGGTLVLSSDGHVRGPGSSATVEAAGHDYLIHHMYDADHRGRPTLQVRPLVWDADGWPLAGEPITRPPGTPPPVARGPAGAWVVTTDFRRPVTVTLADDAANGAWVTVQLPGGDGGPVRCAYADDGSWFAGRDRQGRQLRGVRAAP